jgi:hypothetical protein
VPLANGFLMIFNGKNKKIQLLSKLSTFPHELQSSTNVQLFSRKCDFGEKDQFLGFWPRKL